MAIVGGAAGGTAAPVMRGLYVALDAKTRRQLERQVREAGIDPHLTRFYINRHAAELLGHDVRRSDLSDQARRGIDHLTKGAKDMSLTDQVETFRNELTLDNVDGIRDRIRSSHLGPDRRRELLDVLRDVEEGHGTGDPEVIRRRLDRVMEQVHSDERFDHFADAQQGEGWWKLIAKRDGEDRWIRAHVDEPGAQRGNVKVGKDGNQRFHPDREDGGRGAGDGGDRPGPKDSPGNPHDPHGPGDDPQDSGDIPDRHRHRRLPDPPTDPQPDPSERPGFSDRIGADDETPADRHGRQIA